MNPFANHTADAAAAPEPEPRHAMGEELFYPPAAGTAGMVVTERTAIKFPTLLAILNVLATDVAALPCRVYRRQADGGRQLAAGHAVDDLLNVSPDGETTAFSFRQSLVAHALLYGNGYAEIVRKGSGTAAALHLLDPERVEVKRDPDTRALRYWIDGQDKLPASNVFHLAGLGYDGISGWNFVRLIDTAIGVGLAEEAFQGDFFANGADPAGVIQMKNSIKDRGKRKQFLDDWNDRHRGPGKRHGTALLEEGAEYHATGVDPDKAQLLDSRKHQVLEVARPWRVPPHKVGDYSQAHLANLEESNLDYLTTALMPWLVAFEQQAALKLFTPSERKAGVYAEHTVEALLRGDLQGRYQAYEIAIRNGWMNRDEVRRRENQSPIGDEAGGSKYTVQLNLTDLSKVGEDAAPEPLPPPAADAGGAPPQTPPKTDGPDQQPDAGDA